MNGQMKCFQSTHLFQFSALLTLTLQCSVPVLLTHLSHCTGRLGQLDKSLQYATRFLEIHPNHVQGFLDKTLLLLMKGQLVEAIQTLRAVRFLHDLSFGSLALIYNSLVCQIQPKTPHCTHGLGIVPWSNASVLPPTYSC